MSGRAGGEPGRGGGAARRPGPARGVRPARRRGGGSLFSP